MNTQVAEARCGWLGEVMARLTPASTLVMSSTLIPCRGNLDVSTVSAVGVARHLRCGAVIRHVRSLQPHWSALDAGRRLMLVYQSMETMPYSPVLYERKVAASNKNSSFMEFLIIIASLRRLW